MGPAARDGSPAGLRVWIDLSNSPHPLLFAPISRALEERGHAVLITVRDHAQTVALARNDWDAFDVVGGESPGGRARKARALAARVLALRRWARRARPDVAVSHNSYAQIAAARAARIPAVTAMDFEHQPANNVAFRLADRVLVPEAVPVESVRRQGASAAKLVRYPELKEAIYVGGFEPDPSVPEALGVKRGPSDALVVIRTPPSRALYHRFENPLFAEVLDRVGREPSVRCVVLARHPEQRAEISARQIPNVTLPDRAVDARALVYESDLVIGAGGTMTREAALIGIPTLSIYAGEQPAVDAWLEARGVLRRVTNPDEIGSIERRQREPQSPAELRRLAEAPLEKFVETIEGAVSSRRGAG
jgi:predicted glycosyltransferase